MIEAVAVLIITCVLCGGALLSLLLRPAEPPSKDWTDWLREAEAQRDTHTDN